MSLRIPAVAALLVITGISYAQSSAKAADLEQANGNYLPTGVYAVQLEKPVIISVVDGQITGHTDVQSYYQAEFDKLDVNQNGQLDRNEQVLVSEADETRINLATGGYNKNMSPSLDVVKTISREDYVSKHTQVVYSAFYGANTTIDPQEWLSYQTGQKVALLDD